MKILFLTAHFGLIRNFEAGIRELARRGHSVVLAAQRQEPLGGDRLVRDLAGSYPRVAYQWVGPMESRDWFALGRALRLSLDYLRYLHPRYAHSPKLRQRAAEQAPPSLVRWSRLPLLRTRPAHSILAALFRLAERSVPIAPEVDRFIADQSPDVFLVSPLLYFGSSQVDFVRSAMAKGIPTGLCVASWDHLTTKGLIHVIPDCVLVWNEPQKREAVEQHGIPEEHIVVTGAHAYDHWFEWSPRPLETFCATVGLPPERPFLLYLGSSPFIAPNEPEFVREWLTRIRAQESLREVSILIRPHPQNGDRWHTLDLSGFENVRVWPPKGANPIDETAKSDYFDSIYHSFAVVGVNTSGLIEAGIIGRPVYTILAKDFAETQEGTLHFRHLVGVNGGLLYVAKDMEENLAHLAQSLSRHPNGEKGRRFVEAFIRPHGMDRAAAPIFADAVEALYGQRPKRFGIPIWQTLIRPVLYPFARRAADALRQEQAHRNRKKSETGKSKRPVPPPDDSATTTRAELNR